MKFVSKKIDFSTKGNSEIRDLTDEVSKCLKRTNLSSGFVHLFIPGATGGLTTMECEPGLINDLQKTFQRIAPEDIEYLHNLTHTDRNAHSHICASLVGPSLCIPFEHATLQLGKWQQIIFIDFDNRPRQREVILQIIGEK
jgi:secondary thiamine-phosphate synthase enzyme